MTRTGPTPNIQISPCGLGELFSHLYAKLTVSKSLLTKPQKETTVYSGAVELTKWTHWIGCTVPDDPEIGRSVDACLFEELSASKMQSDGETYRRGSNSDHPDSNRHLHSGLNLHPC